MHFNRMSITGSISNQCIIIITITFALFHARDSLAHRRESCFKNTSYHSSDNNPYPTNQRCLTLNHPFCLDIRLDYDLVSIPDYIPDLNLTAIDEIVAFHAAWQPVQQVDPRCWAHLRVALCSITMPQCIEDTSGRRSKIARPNLEICQDLTTRNNCKFLQRHNRWPSLFNCSDSNLYLKGCTNDLREFRHEKSNANSISCHYPLVFTDDNRTWFKDIKNCGLPCKFPVVDLNQQDYLSLFILTMASFDILIGSLAIVIFWVNMKRSKSSLMGRVILYCSCAEIVKSFGWLIQFFSRRDIACTSSGAQLIGLPIVAELCVLSFFLIYITDLSTCFLTAHLGHLSFNKISGTRDSPEDMKKSNTCMNCITISLVLFICVLYYGQIDGHGLYGICRVGQETPRNIGIKLIFVILPKTLACVYGLYYYSRTILLSMKVRQVKSLKPKIHRTLIRNIWRMSLLATLTLLDVVSGAWNTYYEFSNHEEWVDDIDRYLACNVNLDNIFNFGQESNRPNCSIKSEPFVIFFYLELLSIFVKGIVVASWSWSGPNYRGIVSSIIDFLENEHERRRRVKAYMDNSDDLTRQEYFNNDFPPQSWHDIIDMTSIKSNRDVQIYSQDRSLERETLPKRRPSTVSKNSLRPSLGSTSIAYSGVSNVQINNYNLIRGPSKRKPGMSSRDVVNDQRLKQAMSEYQGLLMGCEPNPYSTVGLPAENPLLNQVTPEDNIGILPFEVMIIHRYIEFLKIRSNDTNNDDGNMDFEPTFTQYICE